MTAMLSPYCTGAFTPAGNAACTRPPQAGQAHTCAPNMRPVLGDEKRRRGWQVKDLSPHMPVANNAGQAVLTARTDDFEQVARPGLTRWAVSMRISRHRNAKQEMNPPDPIQIVAVGPPGQLHTNP